MVKPWEKYGTVADAAAPPAVAQGPWQKYAAAGADPFAKKKVLNPSPNLSNIPFIGPVLALAGMNGQVTEEEVLADPEAAYNAALETIHRTQFPDWSDDQFKEYALGDGALWPGAFAPYDLTQLSQHGALFNATDEIGAAMGAAGSQVKRWLGDESSPEFGTAYNDYEQLEQVRRDIGRQQQGVLGQVVELGSGLLTMKPGAMPAVAPSLLRQMSEGAAVGGSMGAAYGAGAADTDKGIEALKGGVLGFGLGAGVPATIRGATSAMDAIIESVAAKKAGQAIGTDPNALRFLEETLAADDSLSAAGKTRMAGAGQERMIADSGQSASNALDHAVASSGRAGKRATEAIEGRVSRDGQAIQTALDNALGTPQGVQTTRAGIRTGSAQQRGQAYDAAYASPIDYSTPEGMRLEELLSRLDKSEIDAANTLMRKQGLKSNQIMAQVADDGTVTFKTMPDVRQIDYITRALNDVAEDSKGLGKLGGMSNEGRVYSELSHDIRDVTRGAVPEYGVALDTAADPIRRSLAVQRGSEILKSSTTREMVAEWVNGLTKAERSAMAQGLRSKFDDTLANVKRAITDFNVDAREGIKALKELSSRAMREKVALVIGQKEADALFAEIDKAARGFELRANVSTNSKTFQRQNMDSRINDLIDPDTIVSAAAKGEPLNAGKRAVRGLTGRTKQRGTQIKDEAMDAIVEVLTRRGQHADDTLEEIGKYSTRRAAGVAGRRRVANALTPVGAVAADQANRRAVDRLRRPGRR